MRKSLEDRLQGSLERRERRREGVWKIGTVQVCSVFVFKGLRHGREHGALTGARIQGYKGLDLGYGHKLMYIVSYSSFTVFYYRLDRVLQPGDNGAGL